MSLTDLLLDDREEVERGRRVNGVAVGIVTSNHDPQGLGRVKVRFPWLGEGIESDWCKVASFMAGDGRGAVFLPELEDEVLVAFEQGDVNFPYVIGALWNSSDRPPETNADGRNDVRKIRSRSGHEIVLDDSAAERQESVEIRSAGGHRVRLDDAVGGESVLIEDRAGNRMKLESLTGTISIEATARLSLRAPLIEIEATGALTLKASGIVTIQGALVKIN